MRLGGWECSLQGSRDCGPGRSTWSLDLKTGQLCSPSQCGKGVAALATLTWDRAWGPEELASTTRPGEVLLPPRVSGLPGDKRRPQAALLGVPCGKPSGVFVVTFYIRKPLSGTGRGTPRVSHQLLPLPSQGHLLLLAEKSLGS